MQIDIEVHVSYCGQAKRRRTPSHAHIYGKAVCSKETPGPLQEEKGNKIGITNEI